METRGVIGTGRVAVGWGTWDSVGADRAGQGR